MASKFQPSDVYRIQRSALSYMGVWHARNPSFRGTTVKYVSNFLFFITYLGMMFQCVAVVKDLEKLPQILYLMIPYTYYILKLIFFLFKKETFLAMIDHLQDPVFLSYPNELEGQILNVMKITTMITKVFGLACTMIVILFIAYPVMDGKKLLSPVPFDFGGYTPIFFLIEALTLMTVSINHVCLDTLPCALMGLASSEFKVLKYKLINIRRYAINYLKKIKGVDFEAEEVHPLIDEIVQRMLTNCVKHHCAIITFVEQIEEIFSLNFFVQMLGSAVTICNTGFFLLFVPRKSTQFALLVVYFLSLMTETSFFCIFGNEILFKSSEIIEGCYFSNWHLCNNQIRKTLFIMMERAKRPSTITAWRFTDVSLNTLLWINKWSYSYFALLLQLAKKKELI